MLAFQALHFDLITDYISEYSHYFLLLISLLYGNAQSQTAADIHACGGRGSQTPPKTKQDKLTEIDTKIISKSDTELNGTLKRSGKNIKLNM